MINLLIEDEEKKEQTHYIDIIDVDKFDEILKTSTSEPERESFLLYLYQKSIEKLGNGIPDIASTYIMSKLILDKKYISDPKLLDSITMIHNSCKAMLSTLELQKNENTTSSISD